MKDSYVILTVGFFITLVFHLTISLALRVVSKQILKTKTKFDDYLIKAFNKPLKVVIWLFFANISIEALKGEFQYLAKVPAYIDILFILVLLWFLLSIVSQTEKYLTHESDKFENSVILLFSRVVKIIITFLVVLSTLQFFGIGISSILTFGGIGGMVIGFAAKDMLANIFGGLMISLDKPFAIGDWIRVGDVEGTVENIGWRMTRIRTFSKNPIYVPNNNFSTQAIETPSRMTNRRIYEKIGVRYDDINIINSLIIDLEKMLLNHIDIDKKALTMVYFNSFGDSSLEIVVYTFTQTTNWVEFQKVKGKILLKIADILANHKAEMAFPTQTIYMKNE